jgi:hypothetical protein
MRRRTTAYSIVGSLCFVLLLMAMITAPYGCEWGLAAYLWSGVGAVLVVLSMPYFMRRAFVRHSRMPAALGFAMLALFTWLVGWFVAFANSACRF